jgi:hypothetical protein
LLIIGRYGRNATLEQGGKVLSRIDESVAMLQEKLAAGELIYGEYMASLIPVTSSFVHSYDYTLNATMTRRSEGSELMTLYRREHRLRR